MPPARKTNGEHRLSQALAVVSRNEELAGTATPESNWIGQDRTEDVAEVVWRLTLRNAKPGPSAEHDKREWTNQHQPSSERNKTPK
jgi:hypothetical protein